MEYKWFDKREQGENVYLSGSESDTFAWLPDIYFLLAREVSDPSLITYKISRIESFRSTIWTTRSICWWRTGTCSMTRRCQSKSPVSLTPPTTLSIKVCSETLWLNRGQHSQMCLLSVECSVMLSSYAFDDTMVQLSWREESPVDFPETYDRLEYIGFKWADNDPITTTAVNYFTRFQNALTSWESSIIF